MLRHIIVAFLLISAACAMHLEYLKVNSDEEHLDDILDEILIIDKVKCWMCERVMKWLKKHISNKDKAEVIKQKLHKVCNLFPLDKSSCKNLISKHMDFLTEELSTNDGPVTICTKINFCTPKPLPEFIQVQQML